MRSATRRASIIYVLLLSATAALAESGPINAHVEPGVTIPIPSSGYAGTGFMGALKVDVPVAGPLAIQGQAMMTTVPAAVRGSGSIYGAGLGVRVRLLDDHKGYRFGGASLGNWFGNLWFDGGLIFSGTSSLNRLGVDVGVGVQSSLFQGLQIGPFLKFTNADSLSMVTGGLSLTLGSDRPDAPVDTDKDGIFDPADKCPTQPEDKDGFKDDDGCPEKDNDADGIADGEDKCPNEAEDKDGFEDADGVEDSADKCPQNPEDKDGFEDEDGCPDLDDDRDGIPDTVDRCPKEPETYNGNQDEDGCPEQEAKVFVTRDQVVITEKVYFPFNKATIEKRSHALLSSVADVFRKFPQLKKVRVDGHTDDVGTDQKNQTLSEQRAKAVMDFLIKAGVEKERLESKGFGKSRPVEPGTTDAAREKNRRVEFQILEPQGGIIETLHKVEEGQPVPSGGTELSPSPGGDAGTP